MKTTLTYTSLDAQAPWPALLTQQLEHWRTLATITAAEVILEQQHKDERAFRVKVRLEVAGPSVRAEARDATLEGALLLVTRDVDRQIQGRKGKPMRPSHNEPELKAPSGGHADVEADR
jgi:ribosome-associated translation inhibitor RaiA